MVEGGKHQKVPRGGRGGLHRSTSPRPRREHTEAVRDRPTTAAMAVAMMCPRERTGGGGGGGQVEITIVGKNRDRDCGILDPCRCCCSDGSFDDCSWLCGCCDCCGFYCCCGDYCCGDGCYEDVEEDYCCDDDRSHHTPSRAQTTKTTATNSSMTL